MLRAGSDTRRAAARLAIALALVAGLAASFHLVGRSARRMLPAPRVEEVGGGAEALSAWRRAGVRGRVLFWFGRSIPTVLVSEKDVRTLLATPPAEIPDVESTFVYLAIRANVFRRVVYVVADDRWASFRARASGMTPEVRRLGRGFVQTIEGVPVVSVRASDRAALGDGCPLVYVSADARELYGDALVDGILAGAEGADLVLVRR